jgi:hypothetical protein
METKIAMSDITEHTGLLFCKVAYCRYDSLLYLLLADYFRLRILRRIHISCGNVKRYINGNSVYKEWQEILKLVLTSGEHFNYANLEYYLLAVAWVCSRLITQGCQAHSK